MSRINLFIPLIPLHVLWISHRALPISLFLYGWSQAFDRILYNVVMGTDKNISMKNMCVVHSQNLHWIFFLFNSYQNPFELPILAIFHGFDMPKMVTYGLNASYDLVIHLTQSVWINNLCIKINALLVSIQKLFCA